MRFKRKKKPGFLETCAASDLAFLLIIYFLVIAGFNINKGFLMNLPAKDSQRLILREELLRFEMNEENNIIHEEEIIDIPRARSIISQGLRENPNIAVILMINSGAIWQSVVYFVELAQDLGVDAFSFSMIRENL